MIVEAGKTYIGRVRATSSERDTLALRLRLSSVLSALDLRPPGLPQSAILCVRSLRDPLPGALRLGDHDTRPLYAWEQALQSSLKRLVERAMYPAREAIPASAEAVIFTDQAEMLACLAGDWCAGNIAGRWWWQGLFTGKDIERVLVPTWLRAPEYIPAALQRLAAMGKAVAFARALVDNNTRAMTQSMVRRFGLYELQTLLEPLVRQGPAPAPAQSADPPVRMASPASSRPSTRARTRRTGPKAAGRASTASKAQGRTGASAARNANGPSAQARYSVRVRGAPSRTARVIFPARLSPGMSRRLFTTRRATARSPTGTDASTARAVIRPVWTYAVPVVATSPKNTNTKSSPKP